MDCSKPHVALFSSPGVGHLIPNLEFAKRLSAHHGVKVTVFVLETLSSKAKSQLLDPVSESGATVFSDHHHHLPKIVELPPVDISGLLGVGGFDAENVTTVLTAMMREAKHALRSAILSSINHRPDVLITDLFGTEAFEIARELEIPKYVFLPNTAWFLSLTLYVPTLDEIVQGEYIDQIEPLRVPGCRPVRPEDVVDPMLDRSSQQYREYLRMGREFALADGILLNTFEDLEPTTLRALRQDDELSRKARVPVYPVGPLVRNRQDHSRAGSNGELLDWLAAQPPESVLFVSFGSGGMLSAEQITELASGLEMSGQRFIWVVRGPSEGVADESFFSAGCGTDEADASSKFMPEGFLTRTRGRGVVVPGWAPQLKILSHPSTGGFLSHCGFNSALESLTNGVPMIAWPLYAEQRLNATMLAEEVGAAVRTKTLPTREVVGRAEIEMMVRRIMHRSTEGDKLRNRVKELQRSAAAAVAEGGSSYGSLSQLANKWQMICNQRPKPSSPPVRSIDC